MTTQRKKILYVITKSNFGGAQRYVYELVTSLPKEHYDVTVAFGGSGMLKERLLQAGIHTETIHHFERDIDILKEIGALGELYTLIKRLEPDTVHLNSSKAGGSGALIARICGVRNIIFTAHGWPFYEQRGVITRMFMWLFSYLTTLFAHRVIVVSEHDREHGNMFLLEHKLVKINTALPPLVFLNRESARNILFPQSLQERHAESCWIVLTSEHTANKNLPALISACASLVSRGHKNFFLTLMGDGEDTVSIKKLVLKHALQDHIFFTGYISEARTYLKAFDIFILPSLKEGLPYGLLEAGAAGLLCVGSNVGGIPEIIEHDKTGYLLNPHEPESIRETIELALGEYRNTSKQQALIEKIEKNYTFDIMLQRTMALYKRMDSRDV